MTLFSRRMIASALALILLSRGAVLAHHGYTGQYDTSRPASQLAWNLEKSWLNAVCMTLAAPVHRQATP